MIAPIPAEKSNGTLEFLFALPIHRRRIWFAKWLSTSISIGAMFAATYAAGVVSAYWVGLDTGWMLKTVLAMSVSMIGCHTLMLAVLPRVRHELDAAMYAFFLGIIMLIWSSYGLNESAAVRCLGYLAPAAPAFIVHGFGETPHISGGVLTLLTTFLWIFLPGVWLAWMPVRRRRS